MATPNAASATAKGKGGNKTGKSGPRVEPILAAIRTDLTMPVRSSNRGSKSIYPFDDLQVGQSFGVMNKTLEGMTSIISNQNRKTYPKTDGNGAPVMKQGAPITDPNSGSVIGYQPSTEQDTFQKHFFAVTADANDPDKAKVRVWRDK